jgi:hypothetical protein
MKDLVYSNFSKTNWKKMKSLSSMRIGRFSLPNQLSNFNFFFMEFTILVISNIT